MSLEVFGDEGVIFGCIDGEREIPELYGQHKPPKRDRWAIELQRRQAYNRRLALNPMFTDDGKRGFYAYASDQSKDHSLRFQELNHLHFEIGRFRWEARNKARGKWSRSIYYDNLARLWRIAEHAKLFDKPRIP